LYRIALCQDPTLCSAYQNETEMWGVIRITPKNEHTPITPFPVPPLHPRNETPFEVPTLNSSFAYLIEQVISHYSAMASLHSNDRLVPLTIEGRHCIKTLTNCIGATRDSAYIDGDEPLLRQLSHELADSPLVMQALKKKTDQMGKHHDPPSGIDDNGLSWFLTDDPNDFIVTCGVIHSTVGIATYSNIAVYNIEKEMGVGAIVDVDQKGSALPFFPPDNQDAPYFYVQVWKRDCKGMANCFSVPTEFPGVPLYLPLSFAERAYLQPGTQVGPEPLNLIPAVVLHFLPKLSD